MHLQAEGKECKVSCEQITGKRCSHCYCSVSGCGQSPKRKVNLDEGRLLYIFRSTTNINEKVHA